MLRVLLFEDVIDLCDDILADLLRMLEHLCLEWARFRALALFLIELSDLRVEVVFNFADLLHLNLRCLVVLCLLVEPVSLLLKQTVLLLDHLSLLRGSVVPVIGLQLRDPMHGHLALVALVLDVLHELVLALAI